MICDLSWIYPRVGLGNALDGFFLNSNRLVDYSNEISLMLRSPDCWRGKQLILFEHLSLFTTAASVSLVLVITCSLSRGAHLGWQTYFIRHVSAIASSAL